MWILEVRSENGCGSGLFCSEVGPGFGLNGQHTPTYNSEKYPPPPPGEEPSSNDIGDQLSEYDSDSSDDEDSGTHEEDAVEAVPVNALSRTVRTRTEGPITLSYRVLSPY